MDQRQLEQLQIALGGSASRRAAVRSAVVALGLGALGAKPPVMDAKGKKRKKKSHKGKGGTVSPPADPPDEPGTCRSPYFTCGADCRLAGACCDQIAELSCTARHPNEPGTNWVCCTPVGSWCADIANEDWNCGACGNVCAVGKHCLNGACR